MSIRRYMITLALSSIFLLGLGVPLAPTQVGAQPAQTPILSDPAVVTPLVTAAPAPSEPAAPSAGETRVSTSAPAVAVPDTCEPNDSLAQACALPLDAVSGPFTFVSDGDQDFYQLDLPDEAAIQTEITVRATAGLDLALSARQGPDLVASGTVSITLAPSISGTVTLRVENRDPRPAAGEQYRVEVRRAIAPPPQREDDAAGLVPDALENNWSFDTATPIAVGVVYDLTFVCPEARPDAYPGGDHDYLLVPVKAGVAYRIATFDLNPGVDTVVELFWGATTIPVAGNDDYAPGGALSALDWTAPGDGLLGVRVAPRNGGLPQQVGTTTAGYRFAVAPLASELARKLEATMRQQANVPTPTATPAPAAPVASAGGSAGGATSAGGLSSQERIDVGPAIIIAETVLRREPNSGATALATLAPETQVTLRGPVSGLWINVESADSILPGWVRWSDLRRTAEATANTETAPTSAAALPSQQPGAAAVPGVGPSATAASASPTPGGPQVVVRALDPALPEPPAAPGPRSSVDIGITIVATDSPPSSGGTLGFATPTPDMRQPVGQVRVQLVNAFGDLLAEGLTDTAGTTQLRRDIRPGDQLRIRVPAWGVELPLASGQTTVILTIPEGLQ